MVANDCDIFSDDEGSQGRLWEPGQLEKPRRREWLIPNLLPVGELVFLVGDEGIGKSAFWTYLAGVLTSGRGERALGVEPSDGKRVVAFSTEDDWATRTCPALIANGYNPDNFLLAAENSDGTGVLSIYGRGLEVLQAEMEVGNQPDLVVADAFLDTLPAGIQPSKPEQIRPVLRAWREYARRSGATVLLISHTNRSDSASSRNRWANSSEFRKACRHGLMAVDNEEGNSLFIGVEKSNLTGDRPTFEFERITKKVPLEYQDGTVDETSQFVLQCVGKHSRTMSELVGDSANGDLAGEELSDNAFTILQHMFAKNGRVALKQLKEDLISNGFKDGAFRYACDALIRKKLIAREELAKFPRQVVYVLTEEGFRVARSSEHFADNVRPNSASRSPAEGATYPSLHTENCKLENFQQTGRDLHKQEAPVTANCLQTELQTGQFAEQMCVVCGKPLNDVFDTGLDNVPLCTLEDEEHREARRELKAQDLIPAYLTLSKKTWKLGRVS